MLAIIWVLTAAVVVSGVRADGAAKRAVSGAELKRTLADRVAYGGWPARDNMFTWRFGADGTLGVDVGGPHQGGTGSGTWRVEGGQLCLVYPRFVAFQVAWQHQACHRVARVGTVFRVLEADGSLHAWFALAPGRDPCPDPNVTRSDIASRCFA
jgi:hypothetical protein